jgi:tetratricopeptide (TPR) repeat protein
VPLLWATAHCNLGNALTNLGAREPGTARLEEAVLAYRDALAEQTRERVPVDWAWSQAGLGSALQALGYRESGIARHEAAVVAFNAALDVQTQERVPLIWARTRLYLAQSEIWIANGTLNFALLNSAESAVREAQNVVSGKNAQLASFAGSILDEIAVLRARLKVEVTQ